MKRYLFPLILRRGQPVMAFVEKFHTEGGRMGMDGPNARYELGVYHDFRARGRLAKNSDYHSVSRSVISRRLYDAFVAESQRNQKRYRARR